MKYLFASLLFIFFALYMLLFSAGGNALITPLVKTYISENTPSPLKAELKNFRLTPSECNATLLLHEKIEVQVHAQLKSVMPSLQASYQIFAYDAASKNHIFADIHGKIRGNLLHYSIEGDGNVTGGAVHYHTTVSEKSVRSVDIALKKGEIKKLLPLLGQEVFAKALFDLEMHLQSPDGVVFQGKGKVLVEEGRVDHEVLMRRFGIQLSEDVHYEGMVSVKVDKSYATGWGALKTTFGNLVLQKSQFDFPKREFMTDYHLFISDLGKLEPLFQKPLKGSFEAQGEATYINKVIVSGKSKSFGGEIDYLYTDAKVVAVLKDVALRRLLYTLCYPQVMQGTVFGDLQYDLVSRSGALKSHLEHLHFLPNPLTSSVKKYIGTDITKKEFEKSNVHAIVEREYVVVDINATGKDISVLLKDARIDKTADTIDAKFEIMLDQKAYFGTISGDLSAPQIRFDTARYIQSSVDKVIDQMIDKKTQKQIHKQLKTLGVEELNSSRILKNIINAVF